MMVFHGVYLDIFCVLITFFFLLGLDGVIENLNSFYIDGRLDVVTVTVKGREFQAHKTVLAARSPVFAAMFEHDMGEKNSNSVTIIDCDPESFHEFLRFLYIEKLEDVSPSKALNLYETAHKYDVKKLMEKCVQLLECNFNTDTFYDIVILAINYHEAKLLDRVTEFFLESVNWQLFLTENPTFAKELLRKFLRRI